jgi:uncharacterized protein (DUF362 family)
MSRVLVARPGDTDVGKCLDFMEACELVTGKKVLVKPNLTTNMQASTGVTTHPYLVSDAVRYLLDSEAAEVVIGEGCWGRVSPAYESLGFYEMGKELGVRIIDFHDDEEVRVKVPDPLAVETFGIARTVLESEVILNIPVLKIHAGESRVTLCAKNMMGCIARDKGFMHANFNAKIIDLLKIVRPDLNIVDGIVGMEKEEIQGSPVGANVLVAGSDFVAVDSICSRIMGFGPGEVEHIEMAARHGFGTADPSAMRIQGFDPTGIVRRFERARA